MPVSHSSFLAAAVKSRSARSSWTGGPGLRFRPRFFENTNQMPWSLHSRCGQPQAVLYGAMYTL
jgi:hypothetical protein